VTPAPRARLFARSLLLQAGFSDERRQGLGFAWAIDPALVAAFGRAGTALAAARARQLSSFNTNPSAAGLVLGATAALEARAAAGDAQAAARAATLKQAVGAALAGAADALFWGALRPLAAGLAVLAAIGAWRLGLPRPAVTGAGLGVLAFAAPALAARWLGVDRGLRDADRAALALAALPAQRAIQAARWAAAVVVFAAAAAALSLPAWESRRVLSAAAFAAGAGLSRAGVGALRLALAAGLLGAAAAAAAGWAP